MSSPLVHMSAVTKHFGARQVLAGLDWQIAPGQVVGLLGRNGAGKSTLLECLLGLRELDGGAVALFGEAPDDLSDQARARIGYVPQKTDLFDWLTPLQMFDYSGRCTRAGTRARSRACCRAGISIRKLSGGEQQRLAIIRALAHDPALLILDEPVASLDPVGRRDFLRELVEQVIERGTTVVFSTHILSDLERVAFDLAFLKDGKIALQGQIDTLLEGARRIVAPTAALPHGPLAGEVSRRADGVMASVLVQAPGADVERLRVQPGVRVEALSLEDLFIEVTQ
jgi:ABC-2 type transport system ATP-binding protein